MPNLISIEPLDAQAVRHIWQLARQPEQPIPGSVGWSFEGNGIRTRTTFLQAFRALGLDTIELPNLLKTGERVQDIAGYLDPFYSLYVVRESNHARLAEFAQASARPVINAMSAAGHPCEVLADGFGLEMALGPLEGLQIALWGPPTNVFRSWVELAGVLGMELIHFCPPALQTPVASVRYCAADEIGAAGPIDVVITDGWPADFCEGGWQLSPTLLAALGAPRLLPTPPFTVGREVGFDPVDYAGFMGYEQKQALLPVQRAIIQYCLAGG